MADRISISPKIRAAVLTAFDGRCAKCQTDENPEGFEIDHIVALCLGGDNTVENFQPLCNPCHKNKGAYKKRLTLAISSVNILCVDPLWAPTRSGRSGYEPWMGI